MRSLLICMAISPLLLAGCGFTHIVTVSPGYTGTGTYSTTVTVPRTHAATTTTRIIATDDMSLCLDLQAVAAAFAQSSTVRDFECLLNDSSYMLSNLDLNNDGYVDYLRVMETVEGRSHVFVIQAVLGANVYQDVATLVAEVPAAGVSWCVQIIGAPYIYGPSYIVQPVFMAVPAIFSHFAVPVYRPWRSPWYWGYYPPRYRRPAPIYLGHYQAYVSTYISNHRYCREVSYVQVCHYPEYDRVSRELQRNDYGSQHPERSFTVRNADIPTKNVTTSSGQTVRSANARDVRERQEASAVKGTATSSSRQSSVSSSSRAGTARTASSASTASSRSGSSSSRSSASSTTTRSSSSSSSRSSRTSSPSSSTKSQTNTVRSRVNSSGRVNTTNSGSTGRTGGTGRR